MKVTEPLRGGAGRKRDWAERAAERIVETRVMDRTAALKVIAAALRRAKKRGYEQAMRDRDVIDSDKGIERDLS